MTRRFLRRTLSLLLALALGVGTSVHGVQASAMAGPMVDAVSAGMLPADTGDCCGGDDEAGMGAAACVSICPMILPAELIAPVPPFTPFGIIASSGSSGRVGSPDPYPPKPSLFS